MLSEENISIRICCEEKLKTELVNQELDYPATIEIDLAELGAPVNECRLHVEFFGWDSFKPQDYNFEENSDEASGINDSL